MKPKVAINGFGRIGRNVFRANLERNLLDIVAINDLTDTHTLAHLLKYDSIYGVTEADISDGEGFLTVGKKKISVTTEKDPSKLPWRKLGVNVVLECTGFFTDRDGAAKHLEAGAKKVVVSAPGKGMDGTFVRGVNCESCRSDQLIISNASCTTNCLAPIAKVLDDYFGIEHGLMTTIHSYTNDQRILDLPHTDLRRARAAALNMIPTTTGAAKAVGEVLPHLNGKLNGLAIRVPTPTVSITDLVVTTREKVNVDKINEVFKKESEGHFKGIIRYIAEPLVQKDFEGDSHSAIFDSLATMTIDDHMAKVLAWYDNEWAYSMRLLEMCEIAALR